MKIYVPNSGLSLTVKFYSFLQKAQPICMRPQPPPKNPNGLGLAIKYKLEDSLIYLLFFLPDLTHLKIRCCLFVFMFKLAVLSFRTETS